MADFRGYAGATAIDLAVDHQRAADAAAHVAVEDDRLPAPAAETGLGQPGGIGIVGERHRHAQRLPAPVGQGEIFPTVDLVALDCASGGHVDRPAESDAHCANSIAGDQAPRHLLDLAADASRAVFRPHIQPLQGHQGRAVAVADA